MSAFRFIPSVGAPTETGTTISAPSAPGVPDRLRIGLRSSPTITVGGNPASRTGTAASSSSRGSGLANVSSLDPTAAAAPTSSHPLEARLLNWNATQRAFKLEKMRRIYGAAVPIRQEMESLIVSLGEWKPLQTGGTSRVHGDILDGKEMKIDWEDVFVDDIVELAPDMHSEFETKLRMNW